jgi:diguanylate cyclase (GGDEF)-like protein
LDSFTLLVALALASFIMAASLFMLYRASPREHCLLDWSVAGLFLLLSNLLGLLAVTIGSVYWLTPALANAFYISGHIAILTGVRRHLGSDTRWALILALPLFVYALHYLPFATASVANRLILFYPIIACVSAYSVSLLWRAPRSEMSPAYWPMMALNSLFVLQLLVRGVVLLNQEDLRLTLAGSQFLQTSGSLATLVYISVLTMCCALIVLRGQELALRRAAQTDSLSGCFNRHALLEIARREFQRSRRTGSDFAFILLDIDHFKNINDSHGHAAGDAGIQHVAGLTQRMLRDYDTLFRIGGEEFLVLVSGASVEEVKQIAERIRAEIESNSLPVQSVAIALTVSIGVAMQHGEDPDWESVLKRADETMYRSKKDGRNRVSVHKPPGAIGALLQT